jgi:predicted nucleic acid-binding protein
MTVSKAAFLLDTSPLSTLCAFPLHDIPYLHTVLNHADIILTQEVIEEAGRGRIWRVVSPLLKSDMLKVLDTPHEPEILDLSYARDLGLGERSIIKTALTEQITPILDDKDAFIVACRFGLRPLGFQDFIVSLAKTSGLSKDLAMDIVTTSASQYPRMYLAHSVYMLKED